MAVLQQKSGVIQFSTQKSAHKGYLAERMQKEIAIS
jgi:hypothetical protein